MNGVHNMNKFIKKLFGIDKIEAETEEAIRQKVAAQLSAEKAVEIERMAKLTPKQIATEKKEPWVAVLETHVNSDNPRNGFFDLDWNEYFVLQLKQSGYGGETEEAIVDQWFQDLCRNIGAEEGVNMERRGTGYINVKPLQDGKSEIS
jgi:hypothetical protein